MGITAGRMAGMVLEKELRVLGRERDRDRELETETETHTDKQSEKGEGQRKRVTERQRQIDRWRHWAWCGPHKANPVTHLL